MEGHEFTRADTFPLNLSFRTCFSGEESAFVRPRWGGRERPTLIVQYKQRFDEPDEGATNLRSILEEETAIELQHINVKLYLNNRDADLAPVIPVFHGWIQDQIFDELLLDVADYRHVHHGPGLMLIGHEADYSLDQTDGVLGLRYNRKSPLVGTNLDRLTQATRAAVAAAGCLEADTRLNGKLSFNGQDVQLIINDRLLAPNDDKTRQSASPDVHQFAAKLFGHSGYSLSFDTDPRRLLSATVHASRPFSVGELLNSLEG